MNKTPRIPIDDYPALALLAWNRAWREIAEDEALALYEANWRFVDVEGLLPAEHALIKRLVARYGHGFLHV
jgi:hypothetical protein